MKDSDRGSKREGRQQYSKTKERPSWNFSAKVNKRFAKSVIMPHCHISDFLCCGDSRIVDCLDCRSSGLQIFGALQQLLDTASTELIAEIFIRLKPLTI